MKQATSIMATHGQRDDRVRVSTSQADVLMESGKSSCNQIVHAHASNSLRDTNEFQVATAANLSRCRRFRQYRKYSFLFSLFLVVHTFVDISVVSAFRQDHVGKSSSKRTSSSPTKSTLQSQENLVDDVKEGEYSSLQRFLPSSWRNKNISNWEFLESVSRSVRGGGIESLEPLSTVGSRAPNATLGPPNTLDNKIGKVLSVIGKAVILESLVTLLTSNDHALLTELATKLMSTESATAVKTVRKILTQFGDHGVVDVFKEYPPRDVVSSILALSRLQKASQYYAEEHQLIAKEFDDPELLEKLARYAVFAKAAYGWKMDLATRGRLHLGGDAQALFKETGITQDDVIQAQWRARTHRPAYFLVRDERHKRLVLSIRGTWSARDILTDLCCTGEDFETPSGTKHAHHGMLEAARAIATDCEESVQTFLNSNSDYSLVVVGHSLGGGVAACLGTLWEDVFSGVHVYAYGCPCVGPLDVEPTLSKSVVSVVGEGDPFSCLSLGHIADLSSAIAYLCKNESLRTAALIHSDGPVEKMDKQDLKWCHESMQEIRDETSGNTTMYPPGRILYISRSNLNPLVDDVIALREMPPSFFQDLRLHARMLDLSRHVPRMYENYLQRLWEETQSAHMKKDTSME